LFDGRLARQRLESGAKAPLSSALPGFGWLEIKSKSNLQRKNKPNTNRNKPKNEVWGCQIMPAYAATHPAIGKYS
jgi:hypothetical protein